MPCTAPLSSIPPNEWPDPPEQMTVSALGELEACPRRWALTWADYRGIWQGRGYPPQPRWKALEGVVVHEALSTLTSAFARAGCSSLADAAVTEVMRNLGGLSGVLNDSIDRIVLDLTQNPRASALLGYADCWLRSQLPQLRVRVQTLLSMVSLAPFRRGKAAGVGKGRGALSAGTYAEIDLLVPRIAWRGRADLLVLSKETCEIVEFKTGGPKDRDSFQVLVYALLWSRDIELNPRGTLATQLTLAYPTGAVTVTPPCKANLDVFERELVRRAQAARDTLQLHPPQARPRPDLCCSCSVRHLCDAFWAEENQLLLPGSSTKDEFTDAELEITGQHGRFSWDAVSRRSRSLREGQVVILRTQGNRPSLQAGQRVRALNIQVMDTGGSSADPLLVNVGSLSEIFRVEC